MKQIFLKRPKTKSIRFRWLITYYIVLLLPLIVSSCIFLVNDKKIEQKKLSSSQATLDIAVRQGSFWMNEAQVLSYRLSNNNEIQNVGTDGIYSKYAVKKNLMLYLTTENQVDDVAIIDSASDSVVTSKTSSSLELYYDVLKQEGYLGDYDAYLDTFISPERSGFTALPMQGGFRLCYIYTDRDYQQESRGISIAISMNDQLVRDHLNSMTMGPDEDIAFVDDGGRVLFSSSGIAAQYGQGIFPSEGSQPFELKIGGTKYLAFSADLSPSSWQAVYLIRKGSFAGDIYTFRWVLFSSMLICVLFGVVYIYYSVRENYKPVKEILDVINYKREQPGQDRNSNEYAMIKQSIRSAFSELKTMETQIQSQEKLVRNNLLIRLLKNSDPDSLPNEAALKRNGVSFLEGEFCVLLFSPEDLSRLFQDETMSDSERFESAHFIIENVFTELAGAIGAVYFAELDNALAGILNANGTISKDTLYSICNEAAKFIRYHFDFQFTTAVGDVCGDAADIALSYTHALHALELRMIRGKGGILRYDDIKRPEGTADYAFSLSDETRLMNHVLVGAFDDAAAAIEDLFQKNLTDDLHSLRNIKLLVVDMIGTLHKLLRLIKIEDEEEHDNLRQAINEIYEDDTVESIKTNLLNVVESMCEITRSAKSADSGNTIDSVKEYVQKHYCDNTLGVTSIAAEFHLSPNYLSSLFKDTTGDGLLSFINTVRMEEAKRLLMETELPIEKISAMVGYLNRSTFSRTFAKKMGAYPQKWRDAMKNTEEEL